MWNGPTVSKTLLGWVVHGNLQSDSQNCTQFTFAHVYEHETQDEPKDDLNLIHDLLQKQWSYDFKTTASKKDYEMSLDDKKCLDIMERTIHRVDNRFETGLLWKDEKIKLPDSYGNALKRLKLLETKMDKNPTYSNVYVSKMQELIDKKYLRKLSDQETRTSNEHTWYLPHFGVVNPNKPTKLRIVFDAASKVNGLSLNDFLLTGPDLYSSLPEILMNFRIRAIAFVGDIKEMFLQILVAKADRSAQRLLWRENRRDGKPDVYEFQVVFFGATCSPCLAQEVRNRNAKEFVEEFPKACNDIMKKHYMDLPRMYRLH